MSGSRRDTSTSGNRSSRGSEGGDSQGPTGDSTTNNEGETPDAPEGGLYTDLVDTVIVEVDYESGAAPDTGTKPGFGPLWDVFEGNVQRLFEDNPKDLQIDREPEQQQDLGPIEAEDFTSGDLHDLARLHRDHQSTTTTAAFYIVFVDGYYADDSGRRGTVLGVSVGQNVIGMFKPVIDSMLLNADIVEQAVLVHEFGHAAGLVNAGVPPTSEHQDIENGRHCTNEDCVMYWAVDGTDASLDFVLGNLTSSESELFGSECIDDVRAAG